MRIPVDVEKLLCAIIFASMTALGFVNIVVRYLTDQSFAATEELLVNGFLLLTVLGAAIAARRGEHLAVTIVFDALPPRGRIVLLWVSSALGSVLLALSAWFAWDLVANQIDNGTTSYGLGIPGWYYTVGLPFGFLIVLARYIQHAVKTHREMTGVETSDA